MAMYQKDRIRLNVSNLCNFKCPNCHVFELGENNLPSKVMTFELMELAIKEAINVVGLKKHDSLMISLYGGETLANKKAIIQAINLFKNEYAAIKLDWIINTNGSLLKEEDILFFKKYNVEIHISVDGKEEIHNLSRPTHQGKGTYHMVVPALQLIKKLKPKAQINSYVMPSNFHHLKDIIDIAVEFEIKKIYLDQFYTHEMGSPDNLINHYRNSFLYGASKNIDVTGPWSHVLESHLQNINQTNENDKNFTIDVSLDGTFYFSNLIETKSQNLQIRDFSLLYLKDQFQEFKSFYKNKHMLSCSECSIFTSCFGKAINQVEYHIGLKADAANSCYFFKKWITYQTAKVALINKEKFNLISTYDEKELKNLTTELEVNIEKLEEVFWKLPNKINVQVFAHFDELQLASRTACLPSWVRTLCIGKDALLILDKTAPPGLRHELGHIFINSRPHSLPLWIEEAVCEWLRDPSFDPQVAKLSLDKGNLFLSGLLEVAGAPYIFNNLDRSQILENYAYIQSRQFMNYLSMIYGRDFPVNLTKLSQVSLFEEAMITLTGKPTNKHISDFLILISK